MKNTMRFTIIALFLAVCVVPVFAQQEITKEEWQKQIIELTAKRAELKAADDSLTKVVAELKSQDAAKAAELKQCDDDVASLIAPTEPAFLALLDKVDAKLDELSRLANQDLWERRAEIDTAQAWYNEALQLPPSVLSKYQDRLKGEQDRIEALRKALPAGPVEQTYVVGTWSKDRDCLWNIAKKPKIYDNPFLWPKIWQGNRDQIKNPDIIHPGQKLVIPPKGDLDKKEKSAARKYTKKHQKAEAAPATGK
jgi:nucleoid-associated protein YgaU